MTNATERDQLMSVLFDQGTKPINLKLFRGFGDVTVTAEDVCRELRSAINQRNSQTAKVSKSFGDNAPRVDVRTLPNYILDEGFGK